jgi:hypothetical protein
MVEPAICAATAGRWPLKPMPAVGRSVAVARASAERRGGPLDGRAGRPSGDGTRLNYQVFKVTIKTDGCSERRTVRTKQLNGNLMSS